MKTKHNPAQTVFFFMSDTVEQLSNEIEQIGEKVVVGYRKIVAEIKRDVLKKLNEVAIDCAEIRNFLRKKISKLTGIPHAN